MHQIATTVAKNTGNLLKLGVLMAVNSAVNSNLRACTSELWLDLAKNARYLKNSIRERREAS